MGSGNILEVILTGGAPWGFRLMGGDSFPLEVAKIRKKSKAQIQGLTEGDVLLSINGISVQGRSHEDAMYMVDNAGSTLRLQVQRSGGKKQTQSFPVRQPERMVHAAQNPNIVSSASSAFTVNEGNMTRNVKQHQFEETHEDGIKSKTFVKQEEIFSKQSPQTHVFSQTSQNSAPQQIFVQVDDHSGYKENISPIPAGFQPKSASSPVPMFTVKNIRNSVNAPSPSPIVQPQSHDNTSPAPFTEHSTNVPMFKVTKFQAHKFEERPPLPENEYSKFQPTAQVPPMSTVQCDVPPAPPLPPEFSAKEPRSLENEPMLYPLPKYTSEMLRELSLQKYHVGDSEDEENDEEKHGHLPIFAPPVQFTPDDKSFMDSGYDENLLTPKSTDRPSTLPDLEITRTHSLESDETGSTSVHKKKKLFSDSAFYDDPDAHYPTIEEQMDLCKKIAKSLTSAANRKARGARMFAKRKLKSGKWIHDGVYCHDSFSAGDVADIRDLDSELNFTEGGTKPLFSFRIPNLAKRISYDIEDDHKMSLTPDEFERLRLGKDKVSHRSVSPNTCHNLVMDLQSPKNRGAKLFQKRAARSEKWVIDETNAAKPPPPRLSEMVSSPAKSMLSPWEAAMENPIGSVEKAFQHLDSADKLQQVNQTFKQQQQQWRQPPSQQPVTVPYQQNVTTQKKTVSLRSTDQPNVITGPNYNRLAKGWKSGPQSFSSPQYPHAQQQYQTFRQEPPPPPPPTKPLKQQENYNRSAASFKPTPHGNIQTSSNVSHQTTPYGGGYGQPQGYTTTDSYSYNMTAVSDF